MNIFRILPLLAAAIIVIANNVILDYAEKKCAREGRPFDRRLAFILTMIAVVILVLRGLFPIK